jgi:hypothetical protein
MRDRCSRLGRRNEELDAGVSGCCLAERGLVFDSGLALNRDARFPAIMKVHRSCPDMGGERECPYFPESW